MNSELLKEINAAPRVALGSLVETVDVRGGTVDHEEIEGVNINKIFVPTVANLENTDLSKYKHVPTFAFAANLMHIGRDVIFPVALNTSRETKFVSPAYFVFRIKDGCKLLPLFLLTLFRTSSFDRRVWFATDSSIRGNLTWEDMCRVKIPLPPIEVQRAYVDAYKGLTALIEENEALLKSLEVTAQTCVAECRNEWPMMELSSLITEINERNIDGALSEINARGVNTDKRVQKAKRLGENLTTYKIVHKNNLVFNPNIKISKSGEKFAVAINKEEDCIVSNFYVVMQTSEKLIPEFLYLWLIREDFARYMRFISCSSVRESFGFDDMCRVKIPLPPIEVQRAIVALYHCAEEAKKIAEEAKAQLALACPAMIQRASRRF